MEFTSNNLTFIIVTFKSRNVIFDCLNSLPKNFSKLIIENSSDEELKKEIEQNYVNTHVILSTNIGMGAGNNIGILKSKTDFVYILNPDVKFNENTFKFLNNSITNLKDFAILSPISDNLNYPNYKVETRTNISSDELNKDLMPVSEIDGYSMIINKKHFSDKNYFDENFFMYLENVDLCLRAKKNNGKLFIVQKSKINHLGAKAVDEKFHEQIEYSRNWHWMWSKFYFKKKYQGYFLAFFSTFPSFLSSIIKFLFYSFTNNKLKKNIYKMRFLGLLNSYFLKKSFYRPKFF